MRKKTYQKSIKVQINTKSLNHSMILSSVKFWHQDWVHTSYTGKMHPQKQLLFSSLMPQLDINLFNPLPLSPSTTINVTAHHNSSNGPWWNGNHIFFPHRGINSFSAAHQDKGRMLYIKHQQPVYLPVRPFHVSPLLSQQTSPPLPSS